MKLDLELLPHQAELVLDTTTREIAFVAGRGSGKTYGLCLKAVTLAVLQAGFPGVMMSPTGPMASKVLIPGMCDALERCKLKYNLNRTERRFDVFIKNKVSTIYIVSAENIRDSLGLSIAWVCGDEYDTIETELAFESWRKISAALRAGNPKYRQKIAASTPEGYGFLYQYFVSQNNTPELQANRKIIKARSYDNPYLTEDFFNDLKNQYPEHYLKAYLEGEFVNMAGRTVYDQYDTTDAKANTHSLTFKDIHDNETLHIGIDFNVSGMSAVVCVIRGQDIYVIDEQLGAFNTFELASNLKKEYAGFKTILYPDPAGNQRKSSSENTDFGILREAGFNLRTMASHPRIRDRVNSVNAKFCNGFKNRSLFINPAICPGLHKSLISQTWDSNDKPKKGVSIGLATTKNTLTDGPLDALGYFIYSHWPMRGYGTGNIKLTGI